MPNGTHCGKYRLDWDYALIPYGGKDVNKNLINSVMYINLKF